MTLIRLWATAVVGGIAVWCAQQFTRADSDAAQCIYGLATGLLVCGWAVLLQHTLLVLLRPERRSGGAASVGGVAAPRARR